MVSKNPQLAALTGLRFFAALAALLHHCEDKLSIPKVNWPLGNFAVCFFFVLSGFILAYAYQNRLNNGSDVRRFWVGRFARIWPLHCFCALLWLICVSGWVGDIDSQRMGKIVVNLALLQSWVPDYRWGFSLNAVSWSISDELFFYATFPLLFIGNGRYFGRCYVLITLGTVAALGLAQLLFQAGWHPDWLNYRALVHLNPALRLLEFATGVGLGILFNLRQATNPVGSKFRLMDFAKELLAIGLLLGAALVIRNGWLSLGLKSIHQSTAVTEAWCRFSSAVFVFAIFIWIFARSRGPVAWLLSRRPVHYLGEISFSLYMIHQIVISLLHDRFSGSAPANPLISFLLVIGVSVAASTLLYRFIEIPSRNWIMQVYDRNWLQGSIEWSKTMWQNLMAPGTCIAILFSLVLVLWMQLLVLAPQQNRQPMAESSIVRMGDVMMNSSPIGLPIQFGEDATLLGLQTMATDRGVVVKSVWEGGVQTGRQRYLHICDRDGSILRHANQSRENRMPRPSPSIWLDEVVIPWESLEGASHLGVGFFSNALKMSKVSSGPRSLGGFRLDIQLPPRITSQATAGPPTASPPTAEPARQ